MSLVEEVKRILCENAGVFHPLGYRAMLRAMATADLRDVLGTIRLPTLLLYGQDDQRSPPAVAKEFHDRMPDSELVVTCKGMDVDPYIHLPLAEQPSATRLDYLDDSVSPARTGTVTVPFSSPVRFEIGVRVP